MIQLTFACEVLILYSSTPEVMQTVWSKSILQTFVLGPYKNPSLAYERTFIVLSKAPKKQKQLIYEQFRPTPSFQSFNSTVISKTLLK